MTTKMAELVNFHVKT